VEVDAILGVGDGDAHRVAGQDPGAGRRKYVECSVGAGGTGHRAVCRKGILKHIDVADRPLGPNGIDTIYADVVEERRV
jgi:hypothetical protein